MQRGGADVQREWHVESDGNFSAFVYGLRVTVHEWPACARFRVLYSPQATPRAEIMLASGTEPNVAAAMQAAGKAALRIARTLSEGHR